MSRAELQFYETIIRELPKIREALEKINNNTKNKYDGIF